MRIKKKQFKTMEFYTDQYSKLSYKISKFDNEIPIWRRWGFEIILESFDNKGFDRNNTKKRMRKEYNVLPGGFLHSLNEIENNNIEKQKESKFYSFFKKIFNL